jgi:hypothetical protein
MSDITKCKGETDNVICRKREWCLRYTIPGSEMYQSYFKLDSQQILFKCPEYLDNGEKRKIIIKKWKDKTK